MKNSIELQKAREIVELLREFYSRGCITQIELNDRYINRWIKDSKEFNEKAQQFVGWAVEFRFSDSDTGIDTLIQVKSKINHIHSVECIITFWKCKDFYISSNISFEDLLEFVPPSVKKIFLHNLDLFT